MADSVESPHLDVGHSLIVRVIRGAQAYSFWEPPATIQAGDKLIVLHSRAAAPD